MPKKTSKVLGPCYFLLIDPCLDLLVSLSLIHPCLDLLVAPGLFLLKFPCLDRLRTSFLLLDEELMWLTTTALRWSVTTGKREVVVEKLACVLMTARHWIYM